MINRNVKHINMMFNLSADELVDYYNQCIYEIFEDFYADKNASNLILTQSYLVSILTDVTTSMYYRAKEAEKFYDLSANLKKCIKDISWALLHNSYLDDVDYLSEFDINKDTYIVGGGE